MRGGPSPRSGWSRSLKRRRPSAISAPPTAGRSTRPRSRGPRRAGGPSRAPPPPCPSASPARGAPRARGPARARGAGTPARDDLVDEADPVGLVGVDDPAGEDQVHRDAVADDPRQALGAAVAEPDVPAPARDAERRVVVGDAEVGPARPLQAARVGDAVDGGDRRLGRSVQRVGPRIPSSMAVESSPSQAALRSPPAQKASCPAPVRIPTSAGVVLAEARPRVAQLVGGARRRSRSSAPAGRS